MGVLVGAITVLSACAGSDPQTAPTGTGTTSENAQADGIRAGAPGGNVPSTKTTAALWTTITPTTSMQTVQELPAGQVGITSAQPDEQAPPPNTEIQPAPVATSPSTIVLDGSAYQRQPADEVPNGHTVDEPQVTANTPPVESAAGEPVPAIAGDIDHLGTAFHDQQLPGLVLDWMTPPVRALLEEVNVAWGCHPVAGCHYGVWDASTATVWLASWLVDNPSLLFDVVVHELAHAADSTRLSNMQRGAMYNAFDGPAVPGELMADCVARAFGASWTWYWDCPDQGLRELAVSGLGLA